MSQWTCKCGSSKIEEVRAGHRVSDVVGVTLDNGLVCDLLTFVPSKIEPELYFRCKHCRGILPFEDTKALVEFLRKDDDG